MVGWSLNQTDRKTDKETDARKMLLLSRFDGQYCKSAGACWFPCENTSTQASGGIQAGRRSTRKGGGEGGLSVFRLSESLRVMGGKNQRSGSCESQLLFAHHHHLHCHTTGMFSAEQDVSPHLTSSVLVLRRNTLAGHCCSNIEK